MFYLPLFNSYFIIIKKNGIKIVYLHIAYPNKILGTREEISTMGFFTFRVILVSPPSEDSPPLHFTSRGYISWLRVFK